jgi:hypothetical protein
VCCHDFLVDIRCPDFVAVPHINGMPRAFRRGLNRSYFRDFADRRRFRRRMFLFSFVQINSK